MNSNNDSKNNKKNFFKAPDYEKEFKENLPNKINQLRKKQISENLMERRKKFTNSLIDTNIIPIKLNIPLLDLCSMTIVKIFNFYS